MINSGDGKSKKRFGGLRGDRNAAAGFSRIRAVYIAAGGETSVSTVALAPSITYFPGNNQLEVRRSSGGGKLINGLGYYELTPMSIGFPASDPLIAGEWVEVIMTFQVQGVLAAAVRDEVYTEVADGSKVTFAADFSWRYNWNPSKNKGAVTVKVDGQEMTRGVDFTEVNLSLDSTNQITFTSAPQAGANVLIEPKNLIFDDQGAATTFNAQQITIVQNKWLAAYDAIVGSSAQVTAGTASHSSLTSAIAAIPTDGRILVLRGVLSESVSVNKRCSIEGMGYGAQITGSLTFTSAAAFSRFKGMRIGTSITLNASADGIFLNECWQATGQTITDNGAGNLVQVVQE